MINKRFLVAAVILVSLAVFSQAALACTGGAVRKSYHGLLEIESLSIQEASISSGVKTPINSPKLIPFSGLLEIKEIITSPELEEKEKLIVKHAVIIPQSMPFSGKIQQASLLPVNCPEAQETGIIKKAFLIELPHVAYSKEFSAAGNTISIYPTLDGTDIEEADIDLVKDGDITASCKTGHPPAQHYIRITAEAKSVTLSDGTVISSPTIVFNTVTPFENTPVSKIAGATIKGTIRGSTASFGGLGRITASKLGSEISVDSAELTSEKSEGLKILKTETALADSSCILSGIESGEYSIKAYYQGLKAEKPITVDESSFEFKIELNPPDEKQEKPVENLLEKIKGFFDSILTLLPKSVMPK